MKFLSVKTLTKAGANTSERNIKENEDGKGIKGGYRFEDLVHVIAWKHGSDNLPTNKNLYQFV
eukprot:CAMPEP_0114280462 /NCGR_PEP_ID=MMETSP0059-20121206/2449_1 /TAXON_ID=36894 /ORGANISM="Pyramimonas parkeae, Strain CCMP726" /LENGTH=62 /DNA_ID=CAMNT_0001400861 /DNA_START=2083 /DNA_END=2271 /DNA_ORIENTATION=+